MLLLIITQKKAELIENGTQLVISDDLVRTNLVSNSSTQGTKKQTH